MDFLLECNTNDSLYQLDDKCYDWYCFALIYQPQFIKYYLTKTHFDVITPVLAVSHAQRGLSLGQLKSILAGLKKWKKLEADIQDFNKNTKKK